MFLVPLSPPLRRSYAEKWKENQTPLAENPMKKLAERVGVPEAAFANPNGIKHFAANAARANDLELCGC
jgi:hypothetical protein